MWAQMAPPRKFNNKATCAEKKTATPAEAAKMQGSREPGGWLAAWSLVPMSPCKDEVKVGSTKACITKSLMAIPAAEAIANQCICGSGWKLRVQPTFWIALGCTAEPKRK
mmetsp:Transcript_33516/g.41243  ORF Transcript_33516/g.41243 Transcript_33516/m.41243 type:complete len:110 (-) Transcript_33516:499-828(-)